MKLGIMAMMVKQKPSLYSGSQKHQIWRSTASSVQCRSDADCVFLLWGCNSLWISTSWPEGEHGILSEGDEKAERVSEDKKVWFEVDKKWWLHHDAHLAHSPFWFMIFSQNMGHHSFLSLHTRQTLHWWTSFSSTSWNPCWKDDDFSPSRRLKKICW